MPPPQRRLGGHVKNTETNGGGTPKTIFDDATPPVSPHRDAHWNPTPQGGKNLSTLPIEPVEPGSPDAVPDGAAGVAPLERFWHGLTELRDEEEYEPSDEALAALTATLAEHGILQAVTVVSVPAWLARHPDAPIPDGVWWVVVMGGRRLAGSQEAKLASLPFLRNDRLADPVTALKGGLIENARRSSTRALKEAFAYRAIMDQQGISARALAIELGEVHTTVNNKLALLDLIGPLQALLTRGVLKFSNAVALAKLSVEQQHKLVELGPPYTPSNLTQPGPPGGNILSTPHALRIPRYSTVSQVADQLYQKLPPDMLDDLMEEMVRRYREIQQAPD